MDPVECVAVKYVFVVFKMQEKHCAEKYFFSFFFWNFLVSVSTRVKLDGTTVALRLKVHNVQILFFTV